MKLQSDFAVLDVAVGRGPLSRKVRRGQRVEVLIRGFVYDTHGDVEDGVQGFGVDVTGVLVLGDEVSSQVH